MFQANWNDKATNLRRSPKSCHRSSTPLVFLDDNPAERELVRPALPQVAVAELPDDPAGFPAHAGGRRLFRSSRLFRGRPAPGRLYSERPRVATHVEAGDMETYLASLEMEIHFFHSVSRAPASRQLINKSNQFNLTTRRYAEAEIDRGPKYPSASRMQVRLDGQVRRQWHHQRHYCRRQPGSGTSTPG